MLNHLVAASEASRMGAGSPESQIAPALCGCVQCGTRLMIAAPVLGACDACGSDLQPLGTGERTASAPCAEEAPSLRRAA